MDYFIVAVATLSGLYFHWWIYVRIKRWINRDLALSMAAGDPQKQAYMLSKLGEAQALKVKKAELQKWLQDAADHYSA
ncbi:MAG: hypothetical protein GX105_11915 [Gammaproteobacteria bacterium]|jgi:hypothetical protein|nr:hypothetical protein [Pseudomonas sp.]MDY0414563.1 hypothetical protein [Pseudomonas sp.]NLO55135.1 hypothetical protein [Gammaproteobacteria bacterium]